MSPPPRSPPGPPSLKKHHQPWDRSLSKASACFLPVERPAVELSLELPWSPPQGRPILRRNGVCRMSEALKNLDHSFGNRGGGVPESPTPIPSLGPGHSRVTGFFLRPQGRPRGRGMRLRVRQEEPHQETACTCRRLHSWQVCTGGPCFHLVRVGAAAGRLRPLRDRKSPDRGARRPRAHRMLGDACAGGQGACAP